MSSWNEATWSTRRFAWLKCFRMAASAMTTWWPLTAAPFDPYGPSGVTWSPSAWSIWNMAAGYELPGANGRANSFDSLTM